MTTPRRQSGDFRWPVPPSELEDIEVLEEPFDAAGRPLWRRSAAGADRPAPAEEDTAATGDAGAAAAGGVQTPAQPPLAGRATTGGQDVLPSTWRRAWLAAAERAGLLVAGMLIGMAVALVGLPDAARDAMSMVVPERPVPRSPARLAIGSTPLPPTLLGLPLAPPSSAAQVRVERPPAPVASPVAAPVRTPVADGASRVSAANPAPAPTRRLAARPADDVPRASPAVLGPVHDYAAAISRLDARATQAVFPSVDRDTLVQRFTGMREQRLTLVGCTAAVSGTQALVTCRGTLRYRPRVGDHSTRVEQSRWRFSLSDASGTWKIRSVEPS